MKKIFLFFLLVSFFAISCRPSARYRANHETLEQPEQTLDSSNLDNYVHQWLKSPYKFGGMNKNGVDCSGFTLRVMGDVYHIKIPRTAEDQYKDGRKVSDGRRRDGDLVFFRNVRGRGIDHVGVYLGKNKFAHASTKEGVIISDLAEEYYSKRYVGACRYIE
jgi:lipoprotein Spr